jgi:Flp pilus assembly protein TadB
LAAPRAEPSKENRSADRDARLLRPAVRRTAAVVCLFAGTVAVGGLTGLVVGAVAGSAALLANPPVSRREEIHPDDVPMVLDLVGGCLAAGVTQPDALDAGARASGGPLGVACTQVAAALRSGAPAEEAYAGWLDVAVLAPAARSALRTARSGAATADELHRAAARLRAQRRAQAQHRVRRASVWLVVPLGLCFLPAFVLLSVVPLVIGLVPALR